MPRGSPDSEDTEGPEAPRPAAGGSGPWAAAPGEPRPRRRPRAVSTRASAARRGARPAASEARPPPRSRTSQSLRLVGNVGSDPLRLPRPAEALEDVPKPTRPPRVSCSERPRASAAGNARTSARGSRGRACGSPSALAARTPAGARSADTLARGRRVHGRARAGQRAAGTRARGARCGWAGRDPAPAPAPQPAGHTCARSPE